MKPVVIYESKYGSTRQYAQWIAEALDCDLFERKVFKPARFDGYDTIVCGGGLYAGGMSGIDLLTKNPDAVAGKRLVLFTCGLADPQKAQNVAHIRENLTKALPPQMLEQAQIFHLRGGVDYEKLGMVHKAMMSMLHRMLLKKPEGELSDEDKDMLATYGSAVSFVDKESIRPILACVRGA